MSQQHDGSGTPKFGPDSPLYIPIPAPLAQINLSQARTMPPAAMSPISLGNSRMFSSSRSQSKRNSFVPELTSSQRQALAEIDLNAGIDLGPSYREEIIHTPMSLTASINSADAGALGAFNRGVAMWTPSTMATSSHSASKTPSRGPSPSRPTYRSPEGSPQPQSGTPSMSASFAISQYSQFSPVAKLQSPSLMETSLAANGHPVVHSPATRSPSSSTPLMVRSLVNATSSKEPTATENLMNRQPVPVEHLPPQHRMSTLGEATRVTATATPTSAAPLSTLDSMQPMVSPVLACSGGAVFHSSLGSPTPFITSISSGSSQALNSMEFQHLSQGKGPAANGNVEETRMQKRKVATRGPSTSIPNADDTRSTGEERLERQLPIPPEAPETPDAISCCSLIRFNWMARLPTKSLYPFFPSKTLDEFSPGQAEIYDSGISEPSMPLSRAIFGRYGLSQLEERLLADLNEFLLTSPSSKLLDRSIFVSNTEDFGPVGIYPRYTLRFLQFNNYSIEDTATHIIENGVWLSSQGFRYLSQSQVHVELDVGCLYIHGFDNKLRPLLICDVSRARSVLGVNQIEALANYWMLFFRQHLAIEDKVEQMTALVYITLEDIQRANQGDTWFEEMAEIFCRVTRRFPDYIHRFYILIQDKDLVTEAQAKELMGPGLEVRLKRHLPSSFPGFRRLMKRFVFLGSRWGEALGKILRPAQLPKGRGGIAIDVADTVQYQSPMSPSIDALFMTEPNAKLRLGDCVCYGDPRIGSAAAVERSPPSFTDLVKCMAYLLETAELAPEIATVCAQTESALSEYPYAFDKRKPNMMRVARVIKSCNFNKLESLNTLLRLDDMAKTSPLLLRVGDGTWPKELVRSQCVYWYGRDRQRRPILVIRARLLLDKVKAVTMTGVYWVCWWLNYGIEYLLQEGPVTQWNVLMDLKDASALTMGKGLPAISILQRYYKERLNEVWVLNHSFWTRRAVDAWKAAGGVGVKIIYIADLSDLRSKVSFTQIPADLGGTGRQVSDADQLTICMPVTKHKKDKGDRISHA